MLGSLFRLRKELANVHRTASNILGWAETLDELSIEYLAASLLEEPGYSIAEQKEAEQMFELHRDQHSVKSDDD